MKKLILGLYFVFLLLLTFFSYFFIDPNLSYFKSLYSEFIFLHRAITSVIYVLLVIFYFCFYLLFLKMYKEKKLTKKNVKWIICLTAFILFFSYPAMLSFDIFNYVLTSKVTFLYHENPYIIMPIEFIKDPLLSFTHGANKVALYGPSWIALTVVPYFLGFGNFVSTLFNFKLLSLFFYLAVSWIINKISKDFISVLLFSLNPLVVIETLVGGHNDIAMMFFALFGLLLFLKKKVFLAFVLLVISIFIKYSTLFLLPVFAYITFLKYKKIETNWNIVYLSCTILMFIPFILSPLREEIYPWYAIWFLSFAVLVPKNKFVLYISLAFSFSLLFRYVPFMLFGTYFGVTPLIKTTVTFSPVVLTGAYLLIKEKLWLKKFSR